MLEPAPISPADISKPVVSVPAPPRPATAVPKAQLPEPSPFTRQLVANLAQFDFSHGPMTKEQVEAWKQGLQQLGQQGSAGVAAIREYLEKNVDQTFTDANGGSGLGYSSMRFAMLNTLQSMGGPEATAVAFQTLQSTTEPSEIAFLARNLDQQAPEQYREAIVNAVRETLALAGAGKLKDRDVGPLFDVLRQYGGPNAVADLEGATGQWRYYAAIALADMPEGKGIPSLIQMAQDAKSSKGRIALEMLAQVAPQSPDAAAVLLAQAKQNGLTDTTWMKIASVLAGDKFFIPSDTVTTAGPLPGKTNSKSYHLSSGNQNFYSFQDTTGWTQDLVNQRVALIDQMLATNPSATATEALKKSKESLAVWNQPKP